MRLRVLVLVVVQLAAIMLVSSLASARPAAANTWAGVWNTDLGTLTLDAGGSGTKVSYYPGTFTGTVTGNVDKGTWTEATTPPKEGTFEITMSADGHSFTGSWAYKDVAYPGGYGGGGGWNGTCASGECLKNSAAPPPPPPTGCHPLSKSAAGISAAVAASSRARTAAIGPQSRLRATCGGLAVALSVVSPKGFASPWVEVNKSVVFGVVVTGLDVLFPDRLVIRWMDLAEAAKSRRFRDLTSVSCPQLQCEFPLSSRFPRTIELQAAVVSFGKDAFRPSEIVTVSWLPAVKKLSFDYTVPPRLDGKPGGPVEYVNGGENAQPKSWPVDLKVTSCPDPDKNTYDWDYTSPTAGTKELELPTPRRLTSKCTWRAQFPGPSNPKLVGSSEGVFQVALKVKENAGIDIQKYEGTRAVMVQDFLVLGLGDSLGSGEGNPPFQDLQCDRSALSYQALAALALQRADKTKKTSVTFVHLACSGASIVDHVANPGVNGGLLAPYQGINPGVPLKSQLEQAKTLIGAREVDAILLSAGVNDLEFGRIASTCADPRNLAADADGHPIECFNRPYTDKAGNTQFTDAAGQTQGTLRAFLQQRVATLPTLYQKLKDELKNAFSSTGWVFPSNRVIITQYPDTLHGGAQGLLCPGLDLAAQAGSIVRLTAGEVEFLANEFLAPLNTAIAATATAPDPWSVVSLTGPFTQNGYCANPHWVVTRRESFAGQGNDNGALHPNNAGHAWISTAVANALEAQLLPGGVPRKPRT